MNDTITTIEHDAEIILAALDLTPEKVALQAVPREIYDPIYRGGVAIVADAEAGRSELAALGITSGPLVDKFNATINGLGPKLVPPAGSAVLEYFIETYFPAAAAYGATNAAPATPAGKANAVYADADVAAAQAALDNARAAARAKVLGSASDASAGSVGADSAFGEAQTPEMPGN